MNDQISPDHNNNSNFQNDQQPFETDRKLDIHEDNFSENEFSSPLEMHGLSEQKIPDFLPKSFINIDLNINKDSNDLRQKSH